MSDDRKEKIENCGGDFYKNRTCDIHQCYNENYTETCILFHPCCCIIPSDFDQSIAIKWRNGDKIEDSKCYVEKAEIDPETIHNVDIIEKNIIGSSSDEFRIDEDNKDTDNC